MEMEAEYVGVKNISGKDLVLTVGGKHLPFAKDEVKILHGNVGMHALSRAVPTLDKATGLTVAASLYKQIPLAEALKVAKEPENKSVAAAKKQAEADAKRRDELRKEILETLKAEGWAAPKKP